MLELLLFLLVCLIIYNIICYIPYKLKKQDEKISLHFKEIHTRLNRLEKILDDKDNLNTL